MKIRHILAVSPIFAILAVGSAFSSSHAKVGSNTWIQQETSILKSQATNINPKVLALSLKAYAKAREEGLDQKGILTVIDYSLPSTQKRLWVFDLKHDKKLMYTYVAHGKNSGYVSTNSFSNVNGSKKSSLGLFITDAPYYGGHGISIRMRGLEPGFNNNAYERAIVFHGAKYVSDDKAKSGYLGRSWGCPAVEQDKIKPLVDIVKGNTLVFAYYPDRTWLKRSHYLA